jgi:tRNA-dihydrouridine synthase B
MKFQNTDPDQSNENSSTQAVEHSQDSRSVKPGLPPMFRVKYIPVHGDAILAPMDGYSDWPFRSLCRELGSAMSYTEFVKAELILRRSRRPIAKLKFTQAERPVVFQIYGDDPDLIVAAALKVQSLEPDIIDINLGCPARTVANRGAGVGLMRTPIKVAHIFRKLSSTLAVPITAKIRLGWDECRNHVLIARIIEENGGSLIAVHARTKQQGLSGQVDLEAIAEVCCAVKIPVIGNGDVRKVVDITHMKQVTGCQAVMIGRGAIANPWIFSGVERDLVAYEQVRQVVRIHLERNMEFYGPEDGLRLFRKHAVQYLLQLGLDRDDRRRILSQHPPGKFLEMLDQVHSFTR